MPDDAARLARTASAQAVWPIVGMAAGLAVGAAEASLVKADEITGLILTARWGVTGFFLGLALIVLLSVGPGRRRPVSVRRMTGLVAIAAALSWFFARVLFALIGG
ncbi:MAG: hypothetical protein U0835_13500 [Isosphaeraceae bacterium]